MDSGWAALVGSIVGGAASFGGTWLNAYLNRKKPDRSEEAAKQILKDLLDDPLSNWWHISTLANVAGTDEVTVRRLLLEIGARGSAHGGGLWGLVSRNPIKKWPHDMDTQVAYNEALERLKLDQSSKKDTPPLEAARWNPHLAYIPANATDALHPARPGRARARSCENARGGHRRRVEG